MKTGTERKFESLITNMVENTDFESELDLVLKEDGLDRLPEFEFLKERKSSIDGRFKNGNSRFFKVVSFVIAVFVVSGIMTIATNSELVFAAKFQLSNFVFSVRNGFLMSDTQFNETPAGRELLIESEEQITIGKDYLKELKIPGHIPNGYAFSQLLITNNPKNEYVAMYVYKNEGNHIIMVTQERIADYNRDINIAGIEDDFYMDDTHIFYVPSIMSEYNSIYAFSEFEKIYVSGPLELTDLTDILEMFK